MSMVMPKQLKMYLARPTGIGSDNKMDFLWNAYAAEDALGAVLAAVKYRKERGFEPRQIYEVVPLKLDREGLVVGKVDHESMKLDAKVFLSLWDWDKRVEVRV